MIKGHLETYDYCSALSKMMVDARPVSIDPLRIWPDTIEQARSGDVVKRTTGISMQISAQALVRFIDRLSQSNRYFRVDEFKVSNANLHQSDPTLTVEMLLTQAYFRPTKKAATAATAEAGQPAAVNERLNSLFGAAASPAASSNKAKSEEEPSAWQQFRRRWLPF